MPTGDDKDKERAERAGRSFRENGGVSRSERSNRNGRGDGEGGRSEDLHDRESDSSDGDRSSDDGERLHFDGVRCDGSDRLDDGDDDGDGRSFGGGRVDRRELGGHVPSAHGGDSRNDVGVGVDEVAHSYGEESREHVDVELEFLVHREKIGSEKVVGRRKKEGGRVFSILYFFRAT